MSGCHRAVFTIACYLYMALSQGLFRCNEGCVRVRHVNHRIFPYPNSNLGFEPRSAL